MLVLRCCTRAVSSCGEWGDSLVVVLELLNVVASFVAERGVPGCARSVVPAHGL